MLGVTADFETMLFGCRFHLWEENFLMRLQVGVLDALAIFAMVLVVGYFWRVTAMKMSDTAIGQAMAVVY